jgi:hypothetical protein
MSPCKVPVTRQILMKAEFSQQIPNFMKTHPVGAKLFRADRQTDKQA